MIDSIARKYFVMVQRKNGEGWAVKAVFNSYHEAREYAGTLNRSYHIEERKVHIKEIK